MPFATVLLAAALSAPPGLHPSPQGLASGPAAARDPAAEVFRALAAIAAGDPGIGAVQAAARGSVAVGATGSFARRARIAALLPRVALEVRHDEQSSRVVGLQGAGEVDYLRLAPGNALVLRVTWELGALAAAPGEVAAAAGEEGRARRADEAVKRATALHFERQRLRVALLLEPPSSPLARAQAELEIGRVTAELDAATGGLLTRGAR
jgi:hypothetical protein